jgi:shikimate kinase
MNEHSTAPIFLVGFMGAGKTTVGKLLAERLKWEFVDLDEIIEANAGLSVSAIFEKFGEAEFRRRESDAIEGCRALTRTIVALGGGAYASAENRSLARSIGKTLWLDCPLDTCLSRVGADPGRPMLGTREEMSALLEHRRTSYSLADYRVPAGEDPATVVDNIVGMLRSANLLGS